MRIWQKTATGQAELDHDLPCSASNVLGTVLAMLLTFVYYGRVVGQVEVPTGQVNFRGSLPRLVSKVFEPMLHPAELPKES